jgi:hypothetical protein
MTTTFPRPTLDQLQKQTLEFIDENNIKPKPLPNVAPPTENGTITLDDLKKQINSTKIEMAQNSLRITQPITHVKFKNIDGIIRVVRKDIIDIIEFGEDDGVATVFINGYENEEITEKEFNKLVEEIL